MRESKYLGLSILRVFLSIKSLERPLWRLWVLMIHWEMLECSMKLLVTSEDLIHSCTQGHLLVGPHPANEQLCWALKSNSMSWTIGVNVNAQDIDSNEKYLCLYNGEQGIFLTPNKVWHPKSVVTGGSDWEYINYCNAHPPSSIMLCQQFSNPAHNSHMLE